MPRTAKPKPDFTEKQFAAALKRAGIFEQKRSTFSGRRFHIMTTATHSAIDNVPGIYEGYGLRAKINLRLTLKHLKSVKALAGHLNAPRRAPEPTPLELAAAAVA